jgi:hypothetical protein
VRLAIGEHDLRIACEATDIDAHSRRNDGAFSRNYASNSRADPCVDIRHCGDVAMHDRQLGDVFKLASCFRLEIRRPYLDRNTAAGDFDGNWHVYLTREAAISTSWHCASSPREP